MLKINAKNVAAFCAVSLIFLSQFVPTAYVPLKATLLLVCCLILMTLLFKGFFLISLSQVVGIVLLSIVGLMYSMYGALHNNPGALRVLTVMAVWPIVYLLISILLQQSSAIKNLISVLNLTLLCVVVYGWSYLGNVSGILPDYLYFELDQGQGAGFYDGFVEFNLYSISSMIFLVPFFLHLNLEFLKRNIKFSIAAGGILICAALLLAVMTGRRAMILVLILLPFIILFSNKILSNKSKLRIKLKYVMGLIAGIFLILFMAVFFKLDYLSVWNMFIDGFDFSSNSSSASERTLQFHSLIDGWLNSNFLFGAGNGAAASISRSDEFPWAYELTYVYLLFSTGLFGLIFYFGWYFVSIFMLRRAVKKRPDLIVFVAPLLTGSLSLCIAAASNPYMGKFDYLWIVLLPFFLAGAVRYQAVQK